MTIVNCLCRKLIVVNSRWFFVFEIGYKIHEQQGSNNEIDSISSSFTLIRLPVHRLPFETHRCNVAHCCIRGCFVSGHCNRSMVYVYFLVLLIILLVHATFASVSVRCQVDTRYSVGIRWSVDVGRSAHSLHVDGQNFH